MATPERSVLFSERGGGLSAATVRLWFHRLSTALQMDGCSSHAGRRTFLTRAARRVSQVGGSLRDVQELAGHTSLAMTQRYSEGDTEAKRTLVALLERGLGRRPVRQGCRGAAAASNGEGRSRLFGEQRCAKRLWHKRRRNLQVGSGRGR